MKLEILKGIYKVCKVNSIPAFRDTGSFSSVTVTEEEISVVCEQNVLLKGVSSTEGDFKVLKVSGVLDFSLTGVISNIASILAEAKVSIFVLSTFNTDYILVKENNLKTTIELLRKNRHEIVI